MTAAVGRRVAHSLASPACRLLRSAPLHGLMIGVMAVSMLEESVVVSVLGAGLLVAVSVVCAALSRSHHHLREHVLDLWVMALVLVVFLPPGSVSAPIHSHVLTVPSLALFASITLLWALARVWLLLGQKNWLTAVASGAVTAVGLALMAALCN